MSQISYTAGDDKFITSERHQYAPPSYDYGMELTESPMSINASPAPRYGTPAIVPGEKYAMRDEERYPTVVDIPSGLIPHEPAQEGASATTLNRNLADYGQAARSQKSGTESLPRRQPPRTILGMPRRRFFIIATGVGVLILCAIVIGVAVGVTKSKSQKKFPSITSAGVFTGADRTGWKMHVVHAKTGSDGVLMKFNNGTGAWSPDQTLEFDIDPSMDDPMTATSMLGSDGNLYLNIFYVHEQNIVHANFSCVAESCKLVYNDVITKGITYPLFATSAVESVYINSTMGYRVFYHNTDKYVTELASLGDGTWDHGRTISGKALGGSSISASVINDDVIVLYVDGKDKTLYNAQSVDGIWRNPKSILSSAPAQWKPLAPISASYQSGTDILSVYYTGSDARIYEIFATNASSEDFAQITRGDLEPTFTSGISTAGWNTQPYEDLSWGPSDAPGAEIASLAWDNQSRFFRLIDDQLAESIEINGVWSADFI